VGVASVIRVTGNPKISNYLEARVAVC